jgi:hypothetical protein
VVANDAQETKFCDFSKSSSATRLVLWHWLEGKINTRTSNSKKRINQLLCDDWN